MTSKTDRPHNPDPLRKTPDSAVDAAARPARRIAGVRPRVAVLILAVQVVMIGWVADSEIARSVYLICYSLMMPTVLYLLLGRLIQRWFALDRQELVLGYVVLTSTIPIVGFGGLRFLAPGMGYLTYFSQVQPQWARYLPQVPHLPLLQDPEAIRALYVGQSHVPWQAWAQPILFWSIYLLLLIGIWLGLAAVLHRIWIHQERLTFPITVLPLQLTDPRDDLFHRPLFWLGFAVPAVLQSLLALHDWWPAIPAFQLKAFDVKPLLVTSPPWSAMPDLYVGFYPMAIGIAYFVPSSVSFSCWFFWLVTKLSSAVGAMYGLDTGSTAAARFPYREEQAAGAWITFAVMALWGARRHWGSLMASVAKEERRALRWMGSLAVACVLLAAAMMTTVGIPFLLALGTVAIYVAYVISGSRVRAEAGGPWTFAPLNWTPQRVMAALGSGTVMPDRGMVAAGHFDLMHVDMRAQSLPFLLEGLKIAEASGIRWRTVIVWVAIGSVTALALGWWFSLTNFYALGAATAKTNALTQYKVRVGMEAMDNLARHPTGLDHTGVLVMLGAGGFTLLLAGLRIRLALFPFHPVGYVLANTLTLNAFFVPFLIAWLVKVLVQRFGGNIIYRRSLAFFVGLILGDIVTQAGWTLVGRLLDVPVYQFLS
jgi:uncharacterized protein DUF6785/uncharacterized protein DUF6784